VGLQRSIVIKLTQPSRDNLEPDPADFFPNSFEVDLFKFGSANELTYNLIEPTPLRSKDILKLFF